MSILDRFIKANESYNQGIDALERHRYQQAVSQLTRALKLNPRYTLAFINRGQLYQQHLHQNRAAISDYRHALQLDPRDDQTRNRLANLELEIGLFQASATDFRKILTHAGWLKRPAVQTPLREYQQSNYDAAAHDFVNLVRKLDFH